jgi:hypothetical protein
MTRFGGRLLGFGRGIEGVQVSFFLGGVEMWWTTAVLLTMIPGKDGSPVISCSG